ncbi:Site-specific recombinase XerD [Lachnospiraceae bacterium RM5]|nr:Site-specific recombinase XerD [Lachnospiraceae bacterium RM5]
MGRHGEGIRKRKDGRWEGRVPIINKDGNRGYKYLYAYSYEDVKEKIRIFNISILNGCSNTNKVEQEANDWLNIIKKTRKLSTYQKYENIYYNHIHKYIGHIKVCELTENDYKEIIMREYLSKKDGHLAKNTVNSIKSVLTHIVLYCNKNLDVSCIKKDFSDIKYDAKKVSVFSIDEQKKLLNYLTKDIDNYKLGILICFFSGLRLSELCALETKNIDIKKKLIYVRASVFRGKTDNNTTKLLIHSPKSESSIRNIPIFSLLNIYLSEATFDKKYVLNGDLPAEPRTMQNKFKKFQEEAGIKPRNFHTLRHTFATNCINSGMSTKCLSEILGHSGVSVTLNKYVHISDEKKIIELNDCMSDLVNFQVAY